MSKLKVGVVGAGHIAQTVHIPHFKASDTTEVVAVCSRDKTKASTLAEKFSIPFYFSSVTEMLQKTRPDIVAICTPNAFHFEVVIKSLEWGCHVFCEKPPGISHMQAKVRSDKAKETKRFLGYNFPYRQKKETEVARKYIAKNFFGIIYHINASFTRRRGIPGWGNFINRDIQGGGALIDIGVHVLDLALHLLDYPEVQRVLASTYDHLGKQGGVGLMGNWDPKKFTVEDSCFAHIKLKNNSSITLQTAFAANMQKKSFTNVEILGSSAGASLFPLQFYTEQENELVDMHFPFYEEVESQRLSVEKFIEGCNGRATNICTGEQGERLQQVMELIYQSA